MMLRHSLHPNRMAVWLLLALAGATAHAAMTTPSKEKEKQVYDEALTSRRRAILESQNFQKTREAEWKKTEAEAMALRGSANQERLEDVRPIEVEAANAPLEQVQYGSAEVGTGAGIALVVIGMLGYFAIGAVQFRRRRRETSFGKHVEVRSHEEDLAAANQMLAERVANETAHMEILGGAPAQAGGVISRSGAGSGGSRANLPKWKRLGDVLVEMGVTTSEEVEKSAKLAKIANEKLGRFLVHSGKLSSETLCKALASQSGLPIASLGHVEVPVKLCEKFGHTLMRRHEFIPFKDARSTVCIAAANPLRSKVIAELEQICNKKVEVYLAEEQAISILTENVHRKHRSSLRRHFRVQAKLPVSFQFCNREGDLLYEEEFEGTSLDLSAGGMALEGHACPLPNPRDLMRQGLYIEVLISSPEGDEYDVNLIYQVRLLRKIDEADPREDAPWLYGLELAQADDEHRELYRRLIKHLSKEGNPLLSDKPVQADAALGI